MFSRCVFGFRFITLLFQIQISMPTTIMTPSCASLQPFIRISTALRPHNRSISKYTLAVILDPLHDRNYTIKPSILALEQLETSPFSEGTCLGSCPCLYEDLKLMVLKWRPDGDRGKSPAHSCCLSLLPAPSILPLLSLLPLSSLSLSPSLLGDVLHLCTLTTTVFM